MKELQQKIGMALLLITHDLGVVAEQADEVAIMRAGKIVERTSAQAIFARPFHPYTVGLLNSLPGTETKRKSAWTPSRGRPEPAASPKRLSIPRPLPQSRRAVPDAEPQLVEKQQNHFVACHFPETGLRAGAQN